MTNSYSPSIGGLLRMSLLGFILCTTNACATATKEVRPHMEGMDKLRLATGGMTYIFFVPPARAHDAVETVLQENFAVSYLRKNQKSDLNQYNIFSEMGTQFLQYEDKGKKYRKKCDAKLYVIPGYPEYSEVYMWCILDVYELGLIHGRGGIHNLFTQWWDWYPERGLYVTEDLLEMVFQWLKINESDVIRLIEKGDYSKEEILQHIKAREAQEQQKQQKGPASQ